MRRMFSQKQIEEMISSNPEKVLEALQNQDLEVKSISANSPVKEFELTIGSITGMTFEKRYAKAFVSGGILYIIASIVGTNNTEATITASSIDLTFEVDDEVGDKIICVNGEKLSAPYTSNVQICEILSSTGSNFNVVNSRKVDKTAQNKIRLYLAGGNVSAGATEQFIGRQWIALF